MDRTKVPAGGVKLRLVTAAEELFAMHGFEAVSVRDITKRAEMNIASVNYHFGGRDGLVAAVMLRHLMPVYEERLARMDKAERKGGTKTLWLEELVESWWRPVFDRIRDSGLPEGTACKLFGRMMLGPIVALPPALESLAVQWESRNLKALSKILPRIPAEELAWRVRFVSGALSHALLWGDASRRHASGALDLEEVLGRFARFARAGLGDGGAAGTDLQPQALFDF